MWTGSNQTEPQIVSEHNTCAFPSIDVSLWYIKMNKNLNGTFWGTHNKCPFLSSKSLLVESTEGRSAFLPQPRTLHPHFPLITLNPRTTFTVLATIVLTLLLTGISNVWSTLRRCNVHRTIGSITLMLALHTPFVVYCSLLLPPHYWQVHLGPPRSTWGVAVTQEVRVTMPDDRTGCISGAAMGNLKWGQNYLFNKVRSPTDEWGHKMTSMCI